MDEVAGRLGVEVRVAATGRRYYSRLGDGYIGVYRSQRGMEVGLAGLAEAGHPDVAEAVRVAFRRNGFKISDRVQWPMFPCHAIRDNWHGLSETAIPLFLVGSAATNPAPAGTPTGLAAP